MNIMDTEGKAHLHVVISRGAKADMVALASHLGINLSTLVERSFLAYKVFLRPDENKRRKKECRGKSSSSQS